MDLPSTVWTIWLLFGTYDGAVVHVPVSTDTPFTEEAACKEEARQVQERLVNEWPDPKSNILSITAICVPGLDKSKE